ncbi:reverse transcriptase domain-containing protein [Winogradskyella vidalii]|uniref:reverse transcriptase domain-containing protein n=1 Tax=Winogradskyella vidalii TaxID=2615024 RepID=UPI001FE2E6ED|nr:reverse transcriptase domain-containing protein [Winogradskyella vidalii]
MDGIFNYKSLKLAYERVMKSSTKDVRNFFGVSLYKIKLDKNLEDLSQKLQNQKFSPSRPFKYYEPKPIGTQRVKTVLSIEDSIVYQAIANHIAEKVYDEMKTTSSCVFGNVLHENVKEGVKIIDDFNPDFNFFKNYVPLFNQFVNSVNEQVESNNLKYKLDTDITGFFDSIPHSSLAFILQKSQINSSIIELLLLCLNMWSGTRNSPTFQVGIPTGPIASFFIANLLLHRLDKIMIEKSFSYYRYTDDIKVYSDDNAELENALLIIDLYLKDHSLSINSKKTIIEKISSDYKKERKKSLKNQSLSEIILSNDEKKLIESEYFEEFSIQRDYFELNVEPDEATNIIKRRIEEIENEIFQNYNEFIVNGSFISEEIDTLEVDLIGSAYVWRVYVRLLRQYNSEIKLNKTLIPIWLAGLNTFFWRANHFCWNLKNYQLDSDNKFNILLIKEKYKRFEWFNYQTNILYINNLNIDKEESLKIMDKVKQEASPLVRFSLYKILLSNLSDSKAYRDELNTLIKNDNEPYIRYTLSDWIINYEKEEFSVELVKSWFSI